MQDSKYHPDGSLRVAEEREVHYIVQGYSANGDEALRQRAYRECKPYHAPHKKPSKKAAPCARLSCSAERRGDQQVGWYMNWIYVMTGLVVLYTIALGFYTLSVAGVL